jgi:iron complex outermembrane receptor protein
MKMGIRTRLLTATALAAASILSSQSARAQDVPAAPAGDRKVSNPEEIKVANPEEIVVTATNRVAGGLMKEQRAPQAVYAITAEAISQRTPLATPLQLISTVPGANFGTSDTYGLTIRNFLALRGLDQTEIGWAVEGVPAIDPQNYGPFIETFADTENISDITIMAGNSRLQDPILNATGGEFIQSIRDPSSEFGGRISGSVGSFDGRRLFGRIDTGTIGKTGLSAYLSGSLSRADPEHGPGTNKRDHIDFKVRGDWGGGSSSTLFISYNNLSNARVPIPTLAQFNAAKAADNWDLISYLPTYPAGGSTNYYKQFVWGRKNAFVSNINKVQLTDDLTLTVTPYFRYTDINVSSGGTRIDPNSAYSGNLKVTPSFDTSNLVGGFVYARNEQYLHEYQYGVNSALEYNLTDSNHFMAGYWYDKWSLRSAAYIQPLTPTGGFTSGSTTEAGSRANALQSATGQLVTGTDYDVGTVINSFFVGDTQAFFDNRLQVSAGVKFIDYTASGYNFLPGPQKNFRSNFKKWLPRASFSFDVNDQIQVYGNIIKGVRMPLTTATYIDTYNAATGARSSFGNPSAAAESSVGKQLGVRYNGLLHLDVNYFNTRLKDVQVNSTAPVNGTNTTTVLSAGRVNIEGVSAEVSTKKYAGFSLYANTQYLKAKFLDNIPRAGDFLPTAGKVKPLSPKWTHSAVLSYDSEIFFGRLSYKHTSSQYSTFVNDQEMPGFSTLDFSIGARLKKLGPLTGPTISANFINLTKGRYLSTVAGITGNANAVVGINGTTIAGAAPSYYVAAPRAWTLTLSTGF